MILPLTKEQSIEYSFLDIFYCHLLCLGLQSLLQGIFFYFLLFLDPTIANSLFANNAMQECACFEKKALKQSD